MAKTQGPVVGYITHGAVPSSWFRSRAGRRFGVEIALLIILKLVLLTLLWSVAVRPAHRADTSPLAVARHLVAPMVPSPHD